jgi:hypothetical protein
LKAREIANVFAGFYAPAGFCKVKSVKTLCPCGNEWAHLVSDLPQGHKQWSKAELLIKNGILFYPNEGYRPKVLR